MFDEKRLKTLQNIKIGDEKKQADFEGIQNRHAQKGIHWQYYAVIVSIVCITLFLIATKPISIQIATSNQQSDQIIAVYEASGKANPKSVYQFGVNRVTNEEALRSIQQRYEELQPVEQPANLSNIMYTYRFNFNDGSSKLYYFYFARDDIYYERVGTGQFYKLADGSGIPLVQFDKLSKVQWSVFFTLLLFLLISSTFVDRQMREETDAKRKLPKHSHISQSIVMVLFILFLCFGIIFIKQLHFIWIAAASIMVALINVAIENQYGKNNWRKLSFIIWGLLIPTYFYLFVLWIG